MIRLLDGIILGGKIKLGMAKAKKEVKESPICEACGGSGFEAEEVVCPVCMGSGKEQ